MPAHTIHRLDSSEWDRLRALRLLALADSPDAFGSTLNEERRRSGTDWTRGLEQSASVTFVARSSDGEDVGLVRGGSYGQDAGLYSMWVHPDARGQGVGAKLVDAAVQWARDRRFAKILLDVEKRNKPALALYRSKGFELSGVTGSLPPPRQHVAEHQLQLLL